MYETRNRPLLPRRDFYWRIAGHLAVATALIAFSLVLGMVGYMLTERMSALDAFLNAAMLLGGMGPVNQIATVAGKLFAGMFRAVCGPGVRGLRDAGAGAGAAPGAASLPCR